MVEMAWIGTPSRASLPPQLPGSLHQLLPAGKNNQWGGQGDCSLRGTWKQNDQGAQMVQPGNLLKAS